MPSPAPILGSMRFGTWGANLSPAQAADLLKTAADLGITTLDTADIYGDHSTNALIGSAFRHRPGLRQRFGLIAKGGILLPQSPGNERGVQYYDATPEHLSRSLDATLRDLDTDHVEQFLLHRQDALVDASAVAHWAQYEQQRGRIGSFGLSNASAAELSRFDGRVSLIANQLELSLRHSATLSDGSIAATQARAAEIQAWSPLGGGTGVGALGDDLDRALDAMAGEFHLSRAALLLRWAASVPGTRVVLGTTNAARLAEAIHACAEPLPRDAWYVLWQAARGAAVP